MKTDNKYTIGFDIGNSESLGCAVIAEMLPNGSLRVVDVKYREMDKSECQEGDVIESWKTKVKKLKKALEGEEIE